MRPTLVFFILTLLAQSSGAHVKWFSQESFEKPPLNFSQLNHPSFWGLLVLSLFTLAMLVWLDRKLENWSAYVKLNRHFDQYTDRATLILRVFTGASLLLAWQADSMIAPDLKIPSEIWGWFQFGLALLLLFRKTTPVAGLGMVFIYGLGLAQFGFFHLLDYLVYLGVGFFFLVSNSEHPKIKDLRIPALYSSLGFSLFWVALEKIFYPHWGFEVLSKAPGLTLGLPLDFFLLACAFVEMCLGYLLIICLMQRPLALTITLVFFITTSFFGKTEVVGHTLIHGALLVFVVVGQRAAYKPPIAFHQRLGLRMAFASVNFLLLFVLLAAPYWWLSQRAYEQKSLKPAIIHETD